MGAGHPHPLRDDVADDGLRTCVTIGLGVGVGLLLGLGK